MTWRHHIEEREAQAQRVEDLARWADRAGRVLGLQLLLDLAEGLRVRARKLRGQRLTWGWWRR